MQIELNEQLSTLLLKEPSQLLFLCGAGISLESPTSLPTVNIFICSILEKCGIAQETIDKVYQQFGNTNYRFESLIDEIRKKCDGDLKLSISSNRIVYTGKDLATTAGALSGVLVKIHGSQPLPEDLDIELVITIRALAKTTRAFASLPNWKQYMLNLIAGKTVIVMGYSCSDDFDVVPLLAESHPKEIIWLNFDFQYPFPVFTAKSENAKIADLFKSLPLAYFNGRLIPFLKYWSDKVGFSLCNGPEVQPYTVDEYIGLQYPEATAKLVLCNEILLSYGLYADIFMVADSPNLRLQKAKAQFRLGQYDEVIALCTPNSEPDIPTMILMEALYYLSSALYYKRDYLNALETAKKCAFIGWRTDDLFFYLNALINYASILYVYASTLTEDKQVSLLNSAKRKYYTVLRRSVGINIEAEANALWGLGDLARYQGNISEATDLLQQALGILRKIGNVYAIDQLLKTIQEIEDKGY